MNTFPWFYEKSIVRGEIVASEDVTVSCREPASLVGKGANEIRERAYYIVVEALFILYTVSPPNAGGLWLHDFVRYFCRKTKADVGRP